MLTKIHHALIDGLSGAEIMGVLLRPRARGPRAARAAGDRGGDREPSELEMLARGLLGLPRYPLRLLRSLPRALPNLDETPLRRRSRAPGTRRAGRRARVARALAQRRGRRARAHRPASAPKTSLQRPHLAAPALRLRPARRSTRSRRSRTSTAARSTTWSSSICAGAVRRWLIEHDELPDEPLVAQIPVSVRTDEQMGTYGNRIMLMSAPLFTNERGPGASGCRRPTRRCAAMKERHRALPAELLQDANHFIPPAVFARAARATFALSTVAPRPPDLEPRDLERARARSSRSTAPARGWRPTTRSR